ncbi:hypothetical protein BV25DRAFT_1409151 [Artomyces pyxidatus]|uniref:Uncharacterized protein n=1 Tax=Artomyces pyxidatus TaxID=48021 RepID=A0ACB8TDV5_9AGAM|nr:hypothetical protein BV25DRAFT_1409151 [Artomyces pyxidatus]
MSTADCPGSNLPAGFLDPRPTTVIGPIFVGNVINWLLMGTLIVQVYIFSVNFPGERLRLRLLVYGILCLDIVQTVFGTHLAWWYMISSWNNPIALESLPWSDVTIPIMCGLVAGIVQIFYAWQIWVLTKTILMHGFAALIVVVALAQSLTAVITPSLLRRDPDAQNYLHLFPGFEFWLAGSFVADILICSCMLWILYHAKTGTMWTHSESLISKLILNTIRTGTVTVVCAAIDLALFVALSDGNYHLAPAYILGKLYSNSLMATLNGRKSRSQTSPGTSDSLGMRVSVSGQSELAFTRSDRYSQYASEEGIIPKERRVRLSRVPAAESAEDVDTTQAKSAEL